MVGIDDLTTHLRAPRLGGYTRRAITTGRLYSHRLDRALTRYERRLWHQESWSTTLLRSPIVELSVADQPQALLVIWRRRFWRTYVQARVALTALASAWAITYGARFHDHALDRQIVIGVILLVLWCSITTAWSSYLYTALASRPSWWVLEIAIAIVLLGLGGGLDSAFFACGGIALVAPAIVGGRRAVFLAWIVMSAAIVGWFAVYRVIGNDPVLHHASAFKSISANIAAYGALALILAAYSYIFTLFDRLVAVESRVVKPEEHRWLVSMRSRRDALHLCQSLLPSRIADLSPRTERLATAIDASVPLDAAALRRGLALLKTSETISMDERIPDLITLSEVVAEARSVVAVAALNEYLRDDSVLVSWVPEPWAKRFLVDPSRLSHLRDFAHEAATNMVRHGIPPFRIEAHVEYAPHEEQPGAVHTVTLTFANATSWAPRVKTEGYGQHDLRQSAAVLGDLVGPTRAADGSWLVGVRFSQPALLFLPLDEN